MRTWVGIGLLMAMPLAGACRLDKMLGEDPQAHAERRVRLVFDTLSQVTETDRCHDPGKLKLPGEVAQ